jgi:hypothetical protein
MPRLSSHGEDGAMLEQLPSNCDLMFDTHVFDYMLHELHRYPTSEEGGKYIGYIESTTHNRSKDRNYRIIITDFLPGGPKAKRTSVEFLPDGEFQEHLFRQAEARDRSIEHLGTWHSHHCNGLNRLSGGDIEGYFKTVNKAAYRPDVFVASLVKHLPRRQGDRDWIDHFLFIRNHDSFYKVTHHVGIAETPSKFTDITGHSLPSERGDTYVARSAKSDRPEPAATWHETEIGKQTLAEDKRFFTERFGSNLRATRRDGVITITCRTASKFIAVSYPLGTGDRELKINVGLAARTILTIACDYSDREVAYSASLAALEHF